MKRLNTTLLLAALILVLAFVLINRLDCGKKPASALPIITEVKHRDNVDKKAEKRIRDSANAVIAAANRAKDSVTILNRNLSQQLSYTLKRAAAIATDLQLAKADKDTVRYQRNADSLPAIITQLQIDNDKREKAHALENAINETIIREQQVKLNALDTLLISKEKSEQELISAIQKQAKDINKLIRKDGRKYSLGPSINYGVSPTGQLMVSIGISIQRNVLKIKL